jgi:hypothetical protein
MTGMQRSMVKDYPGQLIPFFCLVYKQLFSEHYFSSAFVAILEPFEANHQNRISLVYLHKF